MKTKKLALHWQMAIALISGAICGYMFSGSFNVWSSFVDGIGNIFLRAINMIVIPLVFLSTVLGISTMSDSRSMGRIAIKTFSYFIVTSLVAAVVGVLITDSLRPGYNTRMIELGQVSSSSQNTKVETMIDEIVSIIPDNIFAAFSSGNILPIILLSILLGYFVTRVAIDRQNTINNLFDAFNEVMMALTGFIIRLAPIGIFAIVMVLVGRQANDVEMMKECFKGIALFVIVVWISLIVIGGIILPIMVAFLAKVSPVKHLKQIYSALMVAFSTSSSYSALPLIINDTKEKVGVSNTIASFTVPLGITFNKIGTIVYECVAVIFVAQAVGVELTTAQQISLIGISIVTVLGTPSVPMASVTITLVVLLNTMGLPTDYIGMFLAIDVLCDMPKTMLNAYSVSCSAIIVARSEGEILKL